MGPPPRARMTTRVVRVAVRPTRVAEGIGTNPIPNTNKRTRQPEVRAHAPITTMEMPVHTTMRTAMARKACMAMAVTGSVRVAPEKPMTSGPVVRTLATTTTVTSVTTTAASARATPLTVVVQKKRFSGRLHRGSHLRPSTSGGLRTSCCRGSYRGPRSVGYHRRFSLALYHPSPVNYRSRVAIRSSSWCSG